MNVPIQAIFFDVNGTLRSTTQSGESRRREKLGQIHELVGAHGTLDDFSALLAGRMQAYRRWAHDGSIELGEVDLWTQWILPDYPVVEIRKIAVRLHHLWREATGIRTMVPEAKEVLVELFRRGYRLGIVSNTLSSLELPSALRELEISGIFGAVVLSCQVGIRKPDPRILLEAASRLPVEPARCAYVGNRRDRDIVAARAAGFGETILVTGPQMDFTQGNAHESPSADHDVQSLPDLLKIFPVVESSDAGPRYQASLSTMWAQRNFPGLSDFCRAASQLGFASIELNHQVDSAMLLDLDPAGCTLSSVHEPCPADISMDELKRRDWLISSTDENCRERGTEAIKRSIRLAVDRHLPIVVVHAGMASKDMSLEQELRRLFYRGGAAGKEYRTIQAELMAVRSACAPSCMTSVKRSLLDLFDYAGHFGIRLGLENRYHYYDIPSLDEMGELLALADSSRLGFVYDVGHAQHLDRLGFYPHQEWLKRYASRMVETHLHDVKGLSDHLAPGLGDVDFRMVASYLPEAAIRTLELQSTNTPQQVVAGLRHLEQCGCIRATRRDEVLCTSNSTSDRTSSLA